MSDIMWIALDWGTTHLRAWGIGSKNEIVRQGQSDKGMGKLQQADYPEALGDLIGDWCTFPVPIIACGMVGARQGWLEAAYQTVPCAPIDGNLLKKVGHPIYPVQIIPGICQMNPANVMRGEETQIAGLIAQTQCQDALVCLPGSHTKWAHLSQGKVVEFKTFMTGEMFAAFSKHTILQHSVQTDDWCADSFLDAIDIMQQDHCQISDHLFGLRAETLLEGLAPQKAKARLSGLLVGSEIGHLYPHQNGREIHIIGATQLVHLYGKALKHIGYQPVLHDGDKMTLAGLIAMHTQLKG